jgi:PEP-CTERM motif-containing protein
VVQVQRLSSNSLFYEGWTQLKTSAFVACVLSVFGGMVSFTTASTLRTVVLEGDPVAGLDPGASYSGFSLIPSLNNAGQTAFRGFLTGTGVNSSNNISLWSEGGGAGLSLVAREGSPALGTVGGELFAGSFNEPNLNSAGQVAFEGGLTVTGAASNRGIWSQGAGAGLALVARKGDSVPGTSGDESLSFLGKPVLNGAGQSAFMGLLVGTGITNLNNTGLWLDGGGGGLSLIARGGNQAPGLLAGVNFGTFRDPVLNGAGQSAFWAFLTGPGVGDNSVWSQGAGGGSALVARQGDVAPGAGGAVFSDFGNPVINDAGQTAFSGFLGAAASGGIWLEDSGAGLARVAGAGEAAPGAIDGASFSDFDNPVLNGAGQVAFRGTLSGAEVDASNNLGLWSQGGGAGLELIARLGEVAPGVGGGAVFSDFSNPSLNGVGQTAFRGTLSGAGVNNGNDRGLWAQDPSGALVLIAREGNQIDADTGPGVDLRTIAALSLVGGTGNQDGRRSEFNDLGQLAFMVQFTDGTSGVFVSSVASTVSGDLNGDGFVGIADLNIVLGNWNQNVAEGDPLLGDVAGPGGSGHDGFVGIEDLNAVLGNWNAGVPPGGGAEVLSSVPEPGTVLLMGVGGVVMVRRRRQRDAC